MAEKEIRFLSNSPTNSVFHLKMGSIYLFSFDLEGNSDEFWYKICFWRGSKNSNKMG